MSKSTKTVTNQEIDRYRTELAEELIKDFPNHAKVKILARKCHLTLPKNTTHALGMTLLAMGPSDLEQTDQT